MNRESWFRNRTTVTQILPQCLIEQREAICKTEKDEQWMAKKYLWKQILAQQNKYKGYKTT